MKIKISTERFETLEQTIMFDFGVLLVRLAAGMLLIGAGFSTLRYGNDYQTLQPLAEGVEKVVWIPQNGFLAESFYGTLALILGILIVGGIFARFALPAANLFVVTVALEHLFKNPFYNLSMHILPLLILALTAFYFNQKTDKFSLDNLFRVRKPLTAEVADSWTVLFLRLFLGGIFLLQGVTSVSAFGLIGFAQKVYVEPFAASGMPEALLWMAGIINPPAQILGGAALILGLLTRHAALGIGLFLIQIIFGHVINDPLEYQGDLQKYGLANFFVVAAIIFLISGGNLFSLDRLLKRAKTGEQFNLKHDLKSDTDLYENLVKSR